MLLEKTIYRIGLTLLVAISTAGSINVSWAADAPTDDGAALTQSMCSSCHSYNLITQSSGYTKQGWQALIASMIDLSALPEQQAIITDYLAKKFPPHNKLSPSLVDGELDIILEDWVVPTPGQRPRDPVQAADGSIWWAGQWGNLIGRIDPNTGEMSEYPLPAGAMPHTVTVDRDGNIWFTGNKNGTIGKFDPKTAQTTVFTLPPAAKDPHSAIFDNKGRLFFTVQQSNMIGRLDPASGDIKLVRAPTDNALPYGIKIAPDGTPWVSCFGSNCLIKVNPETMGLTEIPLANPQSRSRRLDIASDGTIWFLDASLGRLGHFDPNEPDAAKQFKYWNSPSGSKSHPYAIAIVDDVIWYNESGMRSDALVRFDPKTETFQSWAIPSGDIHAGIVRHMRPTVDGDLLIHQTATNRIQRVKVYNAAE